jgi:hypothetical protein
MDRKMNKRKTDKKFIKKTFPDMCHPYKYIPSIIEAKKRIVVFGDIHGDYNSTINLFITAKLIAPTHKEKYKWIGGTTYVVQIGDQIDKCRPLPGMKCDNPGTTYNDENSDIKIMEFFNDMSLQAMNNGGAVISLLGNHELLNVLGQMNYVSHLGIKGFENYIDHTNPKRKFDNGRLARMHAFTPGNNLAKMMGCTRMTCVIIGSNLFVHAGITNSLLNELNISDVSDLENINIQIRKWLLGLLDQNYVENVIKYSNNSMFWSRLLGSIPQGVSLNDPICKNALKNVFSVIKIGSMIIGHTPQPFTNNIGINGTCNNKIWRVDTASSSSFNKFDPNFMKTGMSMKNRRIQYLEIIDDTDYFICDEEDCVNNI